MPLLSHAEFLALRRFPALDGIRAIAAVMVVFFHYGGPRWVWMSGWLGVHIFFVLSGFLITTLMLREEARDGRISIANFYIRRAFRILPVYYVILGLVVAVAYLRNDLWSSGLWAVLPKYLTFTNEFIPGGQVFGHSWTLGIEQKFYLVWPVVAFGVALTFARRGLVALVLMAGLLTASHLGSGPLWDAGSCYFMIVAGCALAVVMHHPRGFAVVRPLTHPAVGPVALLMMFTVQSYCLELVEWFGADTPFFLMFGVAICVALVSIVGRGPAAWVLSLRPMVFVGERSYSLYLIQGLAGLAVVATVPLLATPRTLSAVVITIASLIAADVLFRWVEAPMIALGKSVIARRREKREADSAVEPQGDPQPERPAHLVSSADTSEGSPVGSSPSPAR